MEIVLYKLSIIQIHFTTVTTSIIGAVNRAGTASDTIFTFPASFTRLLCTKHLQVKYGHL